LTLKIKKINGKRKGRGTRDGWYLREEAVEYSTFQQMMVREIGRSQKNPQIEEGAH
jgi:hypothetical protein